eukprot:278081_1
MGLGQSNEFNPENLEAVNPEKAGYRFETWNDAARKHLSDHGFVVIKNILTKKEINYAKYLLWNFLSDIGWKRDDPSTWNSRLVSTTGIIWGNGAGQSAFQWYIRTRPQIIKTFANMWSSQSIYKNKHIEFDYKN